LNLRERVSLAVLLCMAGWLAATPALAQTAAHTYTVRIVSFTPIIALIAGILILIVPRLLNYIVAIYLIIIGLVGLFGR
jgi:Protein of unknown function (DUF3096)